MHKTTNLWKFELVVEECEITMEEKTPLSHKVVCFQMLDFGTSKSNYKVPKSMKNYLFHKNYDTSEGANSHNVLYNQQLSIAHSQVSFYANNYFK